MRTARDNAPKNAAKPRKNIRCHPAAAGLNVSARNQIIPFKIISQAPPRLRNVIMSVRQTGVPLGGALAGFTIPWLITWDGWRTAVLVCAVLLMRVERSRK